MIFVFSVPFNDPDETEEQVCYSGHQVCQWQIISDVWKVDFVHLVVAVEKIGLFQKALQIMHNKPHGNYIETVFLQRLLNVKWKHLLHQTANL